MNKISTTEFKKLIGIGHLILAEFYAGWCEPCKILDDILEEVKMKMRERIDIQKIDVDASKDIAAHYHVKSVPVLILFKDGEVVWRMKGFLSAAELTKTFEKYLSKKNRPH